MDWLNYHHLLYFWMAAKEGGISRACEQLHVSQPTVSSQIKALEQRIGSELFRREGRRLVLTETGELVFRYADEIFSLGRELLETLEGQTATDTVRLSVAVTDVVPKMIVHRLLQPVTQRHPNLRIAVYEGKLDELLPDLARHRFDVILSDVPFSPSLSVKAFNHLLGECGVSFLGVRRFAKQVTRDFPQSLAKVPLLLPTQNTSLRRTLDLWFDEQQIKPHVRHEFEDSALLKVFGQAGDGVFPAPTAIVDAICEQYDVEVLGEVPDIQERFFAITVQRRLKHPGVVTLSQVARNYLFLPAS